VENHAKWSAKDEWFYNFDALWHSKTSTPSIPAKWLVKTLNGHGIG
jgi:hypothetical protein